VAWEGTKGEGVSGTVSLATIRPDYLRGALVSTGSLHCIAASSLSTWVYLGVELSLDGCLGSFALKSTAILVGMAVRGLSPECAVEGRDYHLIHPPGRSTGRPT
jgi:hypothetical protein